jgi:pilus assembly protein CpaE
MEVTYAMPILDLISDAPSALTIALIDADDLRREEIAVVLAGFSGLVVREHASLPAELDELPLLLEQHHDVILIGIDSDAESAFDVVESLCASNSATVMVYTSQTSLDLAIRFMRAGAREFLTLPLLHATMADALERVSTCRTMTPQGKRTSKKVFVFLGAKGGCGVTTIASNFAVALAQESGEKTLLIDLGLPLGDAALNLGMAVEYSTANALEDSSRLDAKFLQSLLARHGSGLSVLPAPIEFSSHLATDEAIDKLLTMARQSFTYVVVDAGSRVDLRGTALFGESAIVYLITQVGVSELRNSNRLITQFFATRGRRLQIVLNRYTPHALLFDDQQITKALTRPALWKIPDDYATARRIHCKAIPIALEDTPISNVIRQMARTACGLPANPDKKKGFSFFGRKKDAWPGSRTLLEAEPVEV